MKFTVLDFETYFDTEYSLKRMTTEEYVRDPRFKIHCVSVMSNEGTIIIEDNFANNIRPYMDGYVICHHAQFDGLILSHHLGLKPKYWGCTLSMARAQLQYLKSHSLSALCKHYELPEKTIDYNAFRGVRYPTPPIMDMLKSGCMNDAELTFAIAERLLETASPQELQIIDATIRMFTEPVLTLDAPRTTIELDRIKFNKAAALEALGVNKKELSSAIKFSVLLDAHGVSTPMKISLTTGKEIPALAKTDEGMKALLEHENETVAALAAARLGEKSTLMETRCVRLLGMDARGALPVYLKYWGAHTGRWSGGDKVNFQNLPRGSEIRKSIKAPEGYKLVGADSAQIECRMLNWFAGQEDIVEAFRVGRDIYCENASKFFERQISKNDEAERQFGKVVELACLGPGTMVYTNNGIKNILKISVEDKLWDGTEWVNHKGLLKRGEKYAINLAGLTITPDHPVLCGNMWRTAQSLQNEKYLSQALDTGAENSPYPGIKSGIGADLYRSWFNALAARKNTPLTRIIFSMEKLRAAISVLKNNLVIGLKNIMDMPILYRTMLTEGGYLTEYPLVLEDAIIPVRMRKAIETTEIGEWGYFRNGERIEKNSLNTLHNLKDGTNPNLNSTESTIIKDMNRAIFGSSPGEKTRKTRELSKNSKKKIETYDLAFAGPRNRFTVVTNAGPIIVHNCGYGVGFNKFKSISLQQAKRRLNDKEAERAVEIYRHGHPKVVGLWKCFQQVIKDMGKGLLPYEIGCVTIDGYRIILPTGAFLDYTGMYWDGDNFRIGKSKIYGGLMVENIIQALSAVLLKDIIVRIDDKYGYKLATTTHDDLLYVVRKADKDALKNVLEEMKIAPEWCKDIPLGAEGFESGRFDK